MQLQTTREDHLIAWLTALAVVIHIAESAIPAPIPGFKPGLANIVSVVVLCLYGWRIAAWVTVLRIVVGSLLAGTFLSPAFLLAVGGGIAALAVLAAATTLPGRGFGPIGFSLLAAMAHMAGQFSIAWLLFIPHPALFYLLPILMTLAVLLGVGNGIIAQSIVLRLPTRENPQPATEPPA